MPISKNKSIFQINSCTLKSKNMIILSSDLCEQNVSNGYEEMMKVPSPSMDEVYPTFSIFSHSQTFKQACEH